MRNQSVVCVVLLFLCAGSLWAVGKKIDTLSWSTETKLPRTVTDQQMDFMKKHDAHTPSSLSVELMQKNRIYASQSDLYIGELLSLQSLILSDEEFEGKLGRYLKRYKQLRDMAWACKSSSNPIFDIIDSNFNIMSIITRDNIEQLVDINPRSIKTLAFLK